VFPMEFDHRALDSLPLPEGEGVKRVLQVLRTIVVRRVMPYFRKKRWTDATLIARVSDRIAIERLEDEENLICLASVVSKNDDKWIIHIHERVFDYLVFLIPSDPESRLGGTTTEESKILAFAEFLLRHEIEHMLYPGKSERDVIRSDIAFAMDRRENDPTFYRMLRNILADEMTGLKGEAYLALFDSAEQDRPYGYLITRILETHVINLAHIPEDLLHRVFPVFDTDMKTKVLGECYRWSRDPSNTLSQRVSCLQKVLRLFSLIIMRDEKEALKVFETFQGRWGLVYLFHELDLPETALEEKDSREIFVFFKDHLSSAAQKMSGVSPLPAPEINVAAEEKVVVPRPVKSLKDRIEEARNDPLFSRQALEVIDKNKVSAVGHSGPKYTELIETLLAIPWGKIKKITVQPDEFEKGLDSTHYGLKRPKEIISDFFANLIWRYSHTEKGDEMPAGRTGSAFLFVGPPGVGKTSLAISIAENLGIPYHKVSLGGMRDEADLRGYGFTYEGSKPGAIVQGLIKMGVMNGMFIMDEADKTEKFAISTLLEILDPEQNHLFHDKYTMTTVDIDLSNCHFILTANTLDTVPPPVVNRCEVVPLDRYSIDEKIAIAEQYLIQRIRNRYQIDEVSISFDPEKRLDLLRYLIKMYTYEPGVRELERIIRTLFLRVLRKERLLKKSYGIQITREIIKQYLTIPGRPSQINEENRVGEILGLGVNMELGLGTIIPIQATPVEMKREVAHRQEDYLSMVHATGNIQKIMDESRKVATTAVFYCAKSLGIEASGSEVPVHLHFMGASTQKDGPSAGSAIALALASALTGCPIRRDVSITGEIDTQGRISAVGGLDIKLETAYDAGCKTIIIPRENLSGAKGIERLPEALKKELQVLPYDEWKGEHEPFDHEHHVLQVVAVDHLVQAAAIAFVDEAELEALETSFISHGDALGEHLKKTHQELGVRCCLFYTKDPEEWELQDFLEFFREGGRRVPLARPETREAFYSRYPGQLDAILFHDFDPEHERLSSVIREMLDESTVGVSIVAPYFFLLRDGICSHDFPKRPPFKGATLFANNYTFQGIKIKSCKPILNKVYSLLSRLESTLVEECPFLKKKGDIYVVDLSFIPEKYRLDGKYVEQILQKSLRQWLMAVGKK